MASHYFKQAFKHQLDLTGQWQFKSEQSVDWLSATVPGTNFTDLLANEKIEHPFYRDAELNLQWIEKENWSYRKSFDLPANWLAKGIIYLNLEGLDTLAKVTINGKHVISTDNMFIGHKVAINEHLNAGNNLIQIDFTSPVEEFKTIPDQTGILYPAENDKTDKKASVYTRKAPYHFGWDWGPKYVTSGIWQPISLVLVETATIEDIQTWQHFQNDGSVKLSFAVDVQTYAEFAGKLHIRSKQLPALNQTVELTAGKGTETLNAQMHITNPELWWPNGLGDAHLYDFELHIECEQQEICQSQISIGLRQIDVINAPDEHGESFFVKVNGHPVFMKGANYIPSDSFLTEVSSAKYQQVIQDAVDANMNMLRIWGGGIYENDEFYELADRNGILVWQDFMFACTLYPGDKAFIENVTKEAVYQVKRLRNHACLALWCGNNEVAMGIDKWEWPEKFGYSEQEYNQLKQDYRLLFEQVLADIVKEYDDKFYFASSPISFWENEEDDCRGDNHYWGVWHGEEPFTEFKRRVPRFMSEFGFQSFPIMDSMQRYSEPQDWSLESQVMRVHQKHPRGNQLIKSYMQGEYNTPKDFESFLYLSQLQQAAGMKVGFEAHRMAMPYCMGTLYWQFNDCWPVASWSSIDYYGKWKALHYQAKRSFQHMGVFLEQKDDTLEVMVVSDLLVNQQAQLTLSALDLTGNVLSEQQHQITINANSSQCVLEDSISKLTANHDNTDVVIVATLTGIEQSVQAFEASTALHYLVPIKDLKLRKADIKLAASIEDDGLYVTLSADSLVKGLYLAAPEHNGNFNDNFFDLLPNQQRTLTLQWQGESKQEQQRIADSLRIMSVIDTIDS